jgi:hypothetical protein
MSPVCPTLSQVALQLVLVRYYALIIRVTFLSYILFVLFLNE